MAITQRYGIKYPFSSENDEGIYMDTNDSYAEGIRSQVLHLIFTPKGQKLRDPNFGTNLIKFIFGEMKDSTAFSAVKEEITSQITKYIPSVEFRDINVYSDDNNDSGIVVMVEYGVKRGNKTEITTVAVKI